MRVDGKLAFAVRDGTDTFVPKDFGPCPDFRAGCAGEREVEFPDPIGNRVKSVAHDDSRTRRDTRPKVCAVGR